MTRWTPYRRVSAGDTAAATAVGTARLNATALTLVAPHSSCIKTTGSSARHEVNE